MANILTVAEIAQRLDLPESTVRYYRDRFKAYVPVVGEGRQRRYPQEAVEVFRMIAEGLRGGGSAATVEDALSRRFPRTTGTKDVTPVDAQNTNAPQIASAMARALVEQHQMLGNIQDSLKQLVQSESRTDDLIAQLEEEIVQLRYQLDTREHNSHERDQMLVAEIRKAMARRQPWWRKVWESSNTRKAITGI